VLTVKFPLVILPLPLLGNACTLHEAQFIAGIDVDGVILGVTLGVLLGVVLTVILGVLLGVLLGVGGGLVLVGVTVGVTDGVIVGVTLGVALGVALGVTDGADPNLIVIHKPSTSGKKPLGEIVGVGVGLVPVDGVILGVTLILGVLLTLGNGVIDGVLDTLIVGVGVILGGTVLLGVMLGVTDILGVLLGVIEILGVLLGVILGVTLIVGVMLNDGVGVGVKGTQLFPTQVPKISTIIPAVLPGLLPHTTIVLLGFTLTRGDEDPSHNVYPIFKDPVVILVKLIQLHTFKGVVDGVGVTENDGVTLGVGVGATQSLIGVAVLLNERAPISSNQ
jgi:hypothetical protein